MIDRAEADTLVNRAVSEIESHTGFHLPHSIVVNVLDDAEVEDDTWAEAIAHEPGTPFIGIHPWSQAGNAADAECVLFIGQRVPSGDPTGYEKIAHEVFHCFQYAAYSGTIVEFGALASWVVEGGAAWAGLTLAGGPHNSQSDTWWEAYFSNPLSGGSAYSLMAGSGYSAVGFMSFLDANGVDVWNQLLPTLNAGTPGRQFAAITGDSPGLLASWGSTSARTGWTPAWQLSGPGIIGAHREGEGIPVTNGAEVERTIPNLALQVVKLQATEPDFMIVQLAGPTTMSWSGEGDITITGSESKRYCFMHDCRCPDGMAPFGGAEFEPHAHGALTIGQGTTSDPLGSNVHAVGLSRQDACRCPEASPGGGPGRARPRFAHEAGGSCDYDPCLTGTWTADNSVLLSFLNANGRGRYRYVDGAITVTFAPPTITANYGANFAARLTNGQLIAAFTGSTSAHYRAVAGQLTILPPATRGGKIGFTVQIGGTSRSTGAQPFDGLPGERATAHYTCSEHDLRIGTGLGEFLYHK